MFLSIVHSRAQIGVDARAVTVAVSGQWSVLSNHGRPARGGPSQPFIKNYSKMSKMLSGDPDG